MMVLEILSPDDGRHSPFGETFYRVEAIDTNTNLDTIARRA